MRSLMMILLALAACGPDETLSGYADPTAVYWLRSLDGAPFAARASLRADREGRISGTGPCNSYSAGQTAPYPWFEIGPIAATRRACPALADETAFFAALRAMSLAEAQGDVLILSNTDGGEMVFYAE